MKPTAPRLRGASRLTREQRTAVAARPTWLIVALNGAAVAVASYLSWTTFTAGHPLFCAPGSGCDVVQASRYAVLFGVPTALWGVALGVAVGSLALSGLSPRRWLAAFLLSVVGLSFSAYLTYVEVAIVQAVCGYCLTSASLWVAVAATLFWWRPTAASRSSLLRLRRLLAFGAFASAATVAVAVMAFREAAPGGTAGEAALARHLTATRAVMYGAYWCPHCAEQKALFGAAARLLPYVECDPRGEGAQPALCDRAGIRVYPTWVIAGSRYEGVQSLEQLAHLSTFRPGS